MADEHPNTVPPEADTESNERLDEDAPTEEHEFAATETQDDELATVEVLAEEIEELRARAAERDEFLDKLQRTKADFINYQKRLQRERERWAEMEKQSFALRLLPVVDDCGRALDAARQNRKAREFAQGFELIHSKLLKALADEGVVPFDAVGKPFDPAFHEAVAQVPRPDLPDQTIVEVHLRGYLLGERVLRAAQVVVARGTRPDQELSSQESPATR